MQTLAELVKAEYNQVKRNEESTKNPDIENLISSLRSDMLFISSLSKRTDDALSSIEKTRQNAEKNSPADQINKNDEEMSFPSLVSKY